MLIESILFLHLGVLNDNRLSIFLDCPSLLESVIIIVRHLHVVLQFIHRLVQSLLILHLFYFDVVRLVLVVFLLRGTMRKFSLIFVLGPLRLPLKQVKVSHGRGFASQIIGDALIHCMHPGSDLVGSITHWNLYY